MSGPILQIKNLGGIISKYIDPDKTIVDSRISGLRAYGENFRSEIFKVDLDLKSKNDSKKEELNRVAKIIPEMAHFRKIFIIELTFRVEKGFYDTIVPLLKEFQKEQGVTKYLDMFSRFYGARNNLRSDGEGKVDDDAVLVLENLQTKGRLTFKIPSSEVDLNGPPIKCNVDNENILISFYRTIDIPDADILN